MTRKPLTVVDVTKLSKQELLDLGARGFDVATELRFRECAWMPGFDEHSSAARRGYAFLDSPEGRLYAR